MVEIKGKTILLVEDEAIIALKEKLALEKYGYAVKTVGTGVKAVEAVRANPDIDLILMDINLGDGIDGTQAAEIILEDHDVPIVFVSSHSERDVVEKTEKITSYGYVVKNSSITVLDASIKMALKLFEANRKVTETESKQTTMIANISDVIGILGADGIIKYTSSNIEKWFGWKPEDLVGNDGLMTVHPDDLERIRQRFLALLEHDDSTADVEYRYACKDGTFKPVELTATNLVNAPGINGVLLNYRDITERKRAESAVLESEEKFRALFEKGPIGVAYHQMVYDNSGKAVDYRFLDANSSYRDLTGVDPRYKLVTEAFPGIENDPFNWIGVFGDVARTGQPVRFEQYLQLNKRWYDCVGYRFKPDHFVVAFVEITERKNAEIALQLKNEEYEALNEELRSSMDELQVSANKVLESEERYDSFINAVKDMVFLKDERLRYVVVNDAMALFFNTSKEAMIGKTDQELAGGKPGYSSKASDLKALESESSFMTQELIGDRFCETTKFSLHISGKRKAIGGIIRDITERKRTEAALRESEERLRFALDVSGLGEWELNLKTNVVHRNERWAEMLGYTLSEINDHFNQGVELQHPDDRDAVRKAVQDYHEGRTDAFTAVYRMRTKDGHYKWIQDSGKIMERDEDGKPVRLCGTHADIDTQKRAGDMLERERQRLRNVLHGTSAGTWEWNIQTGEAEIDEASAALLGFSLDEFRPGVFESWMLRKHPDDMKEANDLLMQHVRGEVDSYSYDSRMKHKNGAWIWIQGRGKVSEWDDHGKPLRIFGTHIDITDRKMNELALQESQERLKFALEGSDLGEWDWNVKTNKIIRNERWAAILGYTLAEINDDLQQGVDLQHPDDREGAWKAIQDHLSGRTDSYKIEYRMKTRDGAYKWVHDCGKIMERDRQGNPVRLCGTHADIDEQKKSKEKIQALLEEKELILKEVHHRIKNNMNTITSMLSLQATAVEEPSAASALLDAGSRIRSMSILYDKLFESDDFKDISIKEYLSTLVDEIISNFPDAQSVRVEKDLEEFLLLDAKRLQPLGIIINELLTNTMKHGIKGKARGLVSISATRADGHVIVSVQDDGDGIPESVSFENSTGFGLQLVHALTAQMHGTIRIQRESGTKVVLEFNQ